MALSFTATASQKRPKAALSYTRPRGLSRQGLFISPESRVKGKASRCAAWALFWLGIGMVFAALALIFSLLSLVTS